MYIVYENSESRRIIITRYLIQIKKYLNFANEFFIMTLRITIFIINLYES